MDEDPEVRRERPRGLAHRTAPVAATAPAGPGYTGSGAAAASRRGETTAPPWVLGTFLITFASWVAGASRGVIAAAVAACWVLWAYAERGGGIADPYDRDPIDPGADPPQDAGPRGRGRPGDDGRPPSLWRWT